MTLPDSQRPTPRSDQRPVVVAAWLVTLVASTLPDAIWNQLAGHAPSGLFWGKAALLASLIVAGCAWKRMSPLRPYFILLLIHVLMWATVPWVRAGTFWSRWEGRVPWAAGMLGIQLLKAGVAVLTIMALLLVMRRMSDAFLVKGHVEANAEPVRWIGLKDEPSWKVLGPIVAVAGGVIMLVALAATRQPATTTLVRAVPLLPAAVLLAALNAFNEEVSFRSSLLAPLHRVVGKGPAMAITAVFFGLAHYSGGVPLAALPTILMVAFLGWWMGKSMLETKGFFWAWFIHFVNDIPVFAFLAMGSVAGAGQ